MRFLNKITTLLFVLCAVVPFGLLAQGNNPPPPIPPPPPGLPINDWIPVFIAIGLIYGSLKIYKKNNPEQKV